MKYMLFFLMALPSVIFAEWTFHRHSKDEGKIYRSSVNKADVIFVYEGLPPHWEGNLFEQEARRKDTTKILEYPFYLPKVRAKNPKDLQKLLGDPDTIKVYRGPKECGGFHPDYCISWRTSSSIYYALICFGCHEIIFYDGKKSLIYDINGKNSQNLREALKLYEKKRPRPKRREQSH